MEIGVSRNCYDAKSVSFSFLYYFFVLFVSREFLFQAFISEQRSFSDICRCYFQARLLKTFILMDVQLSFVSLNWFIFNNTRMILIFAVLHKDKDIECQYNIRKPISIRLVLSYIIEYDMQIRNFIAISDMNQIVTQNFVTEIMLFNTYDLESTMLHLWSLERDHLSGNLYVTYRISKNLSWFLEKTLLKYFSKK